MALLQREIIDRERRMGHSAIFAICQRRSLEWKPSPILWPLSHDDPAAGCGNLPATDPSVRGGANSGSSNVLPSNPNNSDNRQNSTREASSNGSNTARSRSGEAVGQALLTGPVLGNNLCQ